MRELPTAEPVEEMQATAFQVFFLADRLPCMYNHTYKVAQNEFFEWDDNKNKANIKSHGVDFFDAQIAFFDPKRLILKDLDHSHDEERFFCIGICDGKIVTVRFTMREKRMRIYGAGYWRKGKAMYEEKNSL